MLQIRKSVYNEALDVKGSGEETDTMKGRNKVARSVSIRFTNHFKELSKDPSRI